MAESLWYSQVISRGLDSIEKNSIQRKSPNGKNFAWAYAPLSPVNWTEFREKVWDDIRPITQITMNDVCGVLDRALMRLADGHSAVVHRSYLRWGNYDVDQVSWMQRKEDVKNFVFEDSAQNIARPLPTVLLKDDGMLHVTAPWTYHDEVGQKYASMIRDGLLSAALEGNPIRGVIVDLRGNGGGSMSPMLRGLSPLLGADVLGRFVGPDFREDEPWTVNHGYLPEKRLDSRNLSNFLLQHVPVAVLVGPGTCSSGEITFLSFCGRENTKSFGKKTAGAASGNLSFRLEEAGAPQDGVHVCSKIAQDRGGRGEGGRIRPDYVTERPEEEAVAWLKSLRVPLRPLISRQFEFRPDMV